MSGSEQTSLDPENMRYYLGCAVGAVVSAAITYSVLSNGGPVFLAAVFPLMGCLLLYTSALGAGAGADGTFRYAGFGSGMVMGPFLLVPLGILASIIPVVLQRIEANPYLPEANSLPLSPTQMVGAYVLVIVLGAIIAAVTEARGDNAAE